MKKNKSTHKLNRNHHHTHLENQVSNEMFNLQHILIYPSSEKLFPLVDSHEDIKKIFIVNTYKTLGICVVASRKIFPTASTRVR